MPEKPPTKGARHIEELMQHLPEESERYQVLDSARRFKSSWVELGEWLARVNRSRQYQGWGFDSFEEYCSKEIRIRRQTAEKLLLAFRFLERREPGLLERRQDRPLPDYRSVDLLRQADEEQPFSPADYTRLRATIIDEDRSHATAARQYRAMVQTHRPEQQDVRRWQAALSAARRLASSLEGVEAVPATLRNPVAELIAYLEERLAAAPED